LLTFLADQISNTFGKIFLVFATCVVLLACFLPTNYFYQSSIILDNDPQFCHNVDNSLIQRVKSLENEIGRLEAAMVFETNQKNSGKSIPQDQILDTFYQSKNLDKTVKELYPDLEQTSTGHYRPKIPGVL
jgi:hypothetical protein